MEPQERSLGKWHWIALLIGCVLLSRCMGGNEHPAPKAEEKPITSGDWYRPAAGVKWQIQLQGEVNPQYPVDLYIIDLFDSSPKLISQLQKSGKHVICYFSAGSSENWRADFSRFQDDDMGAPLQNWPGERWLNTRSDNVRDIMKSRMDLAKEKGCDGVDPDNVDGYTNNPGFNITGKDQIDYNRFLANEAHKRGMAVSLKNDLDQADDLVETADFSVNEQCFQYEECDKLRPFIIKNKPVLNIEYNKTTTQDDLCRRSRFLKFSTLILPMKLDDTSRVSCLETQ